MDIQENTVLRKKGFEIERDSGCITVSNGTENVILNQTVSIVWDYIDGYQSLGDICRNITDKYGENNPLEYIKEVVIESLRILLEYKLVN